MAEVSRFASLMSSVFHAKKAEDNKDDKNAKGEKPTQNDGESDEDFQERLKKWEDAQDKDDAKGKKATETPKDTTDNDQDKVDGKAAKKMADDARAEGLAAGIAAERSRWADTLASQAAAGKPISAISLLADTDASAAALQKTLAALPVETAAAPARSTLALRTDGKATPAPAADGGDDPTKQAGPAGFAARVNAAVESVRPTRKTA